MNTRHLSPFRIPTTPTMSFMPVRRGLLQGKCACGGTPGPTGECEECGKKRLQRITRNSEFGTRNESSVPAIVHEVLRSPGQPLDVETRAFMESRFGHDFSRVRVQGGEADSASKNLGVPAARTAAHQVQRKTWDTLPVYEERPEIIAQGGCEEFPGGSTECEVDPRTGTPTGKVTHRVDEKDPCTKPCVEQHEAVHVKQLKKLCPELRDCYLAADKGKRPALDCAKMAIFGMKERECEAYKVSVPCVERRLANARACQSKENMAYGARKLASEKCFRDKNCGS